MTNSRLWSLGALLGPLLALSSFAPAFGQQKTYQESDLIAVLKSDAAKAQKAITCKRLAVFGSEKAVPELGKLLADPELSSWARIALEAIPGSSVDETFRAAMEALTGRQLIGVINSIATRRDAKAVEGLSKHLDNANEQIAAAAAIALGRIGDAASQQALESSLSGGPADVRSAVAHGCILVAERLLESGQSQEAARLYDKVRQADVPRQRVLEATRGLILAQQSIDLLVEQLQSSEKDFFHIGLRTARELPNADVTGALVSALESADPGRQRLIVLSLAERDGDSVLPAVLQAARSGPNSVRVSAMEVLGRVGDVTSVQTLLDAAADADANVAQAAKDALAAIQDAAIDANLTGRMKAAQGSARKVLIEMVGLRRIEEATAELVKAADDADQEIRSAALASLGSTVSQDQLAVLIKRVTNSKYTRDSAAARKALRTASVRMPDREACATQLASAMSGATASVQSAIVEILGSVGGTKALEAVGEAAADPREELKDIASQSLGKWMTPDAAPVLLKLAQPKADGKYRIRALRGYLRIARQMKLAPLQRAEMCAAALATAARDDERLLALKVLEIHPSIDTLMVAVGAEQISSIKDEAKRTATAIAQKLGGDDQQKVRALLEQARKGPLKIEILRATYGAGDQNKVVTDILKQSVGDVPIVSLASTSYNASFGGDPAPGIVKQLVVEYKINGRKGEASFRENSEIILPMPK